MSLRPLRRLDDCLIGGLRVETRDILSNRPRQQLNILRKIADGPADLVFIPRAQVRTIDCNRAAGWQGRSHK